MGIAGKVGVLLGRLAYVSRSLAEFRLRAARNPFNHVIGLRKTNAAIVRDLVIVYLRWGEISSLYFSQRLDLIGRKVLKEYLPYQKFRMLRDKRNQSFSHEHPFHYICLLRDKLIFERYFRLGGLPVPSTRGVLKPNLNVDFEGLGNGDLFELARGSKIEKRYFCKLRFGIKGRGVFLLSIVDGGVRYNGTPIDRDSLRPLIGGEYLCQEFIDQASEFGVFHPNSVNTLRIVTFRRETGIEIFASYLRIGCSGEIADNNDVSRVAVWVDPSTGAFKRTGFLIEGEDPVSIEKHPDTGVRFEGQVVPQFEECKALAFRAHAWLPAVHSVGWDFALAKDGFVLIEGNDDWGSTIAMMLKDDFVPSFLECVRVTK